MIRAIPKFSQATIRIDNDFTLLSHTESSSGPLLGYDSLHDSKVKDKQ